MNQRRLLTGKRLAECEENGLDLLRFARLVLREMHSGALPVTPKLAAELALIERELCAVRAISGVARASLH